MNTIRLETLSDGIFAIVFTLLVLDIKLPELTPHTLTFWHDITALWPVLVGYFVTFVILSMYWINHTFLYSVFVQKVNRQIILLNLLFLSFISLIPFSAGLLGMYYLSVPEVTMVYGIHILLISLVSNAMIYYALFSDEIETSAISKRNFNQIRIRQGIIPLFTVVGIIAAGMHLPHTAMILFMFPIIFNIIPGGLDFIEKFLNLDFNK